MTTPIFKNKETKAQKDSATYIQSQTAYWCWVWNSSMSDFKAHNLNCCANQDAFGCKMRTLDYNWIKQRGPECFL